MMFFANLWRLAEISAPFSSIAQQLWHCADKPHFGRGIKGLLNLGPPKKNVTKRANIIITAPQLYGNTEWRHKAKRNTPKNFFFCSLTPRVNNQGSIFKGEEDVTVCVHRRLLEYWGKNQNELMCPKFDAGNPRNYFFRTNFDGRSPKFEKREFIKAPLNAQEETLITLLAPLWKLFWTALSAKKKHPALRQL